jgi:hydroxyethylthiazole kinase-like uncharacterized protein yjeF
MKLLTAAAQRDLDRRAGEAGLPTRVLMESAGAAVAREVLAFSPRRVFVFCGPGNNGGDGYVAARLLSATVETLCVATRPLADLKGDAHAAAQAWVAGGGKNVELSAAHLIDHLAAGCVLVDAVFGSGLSRPPAGAEAAAIALMNDAAGRGARVVAVDIPSGVDSDSGAVYPMHLARADATVTFHLPKRGLYLHPGAQSAGRIVVADIGIPRSLDEESSCELIDEKLARALLSPRPPVAHKNDFGHVLVVAGSPGKSGAAALVTEAALRAGAGLVTLAARPEVLFAALPGVPEAMGVPLPGEGPLGLGDLPALREAARGKTALAIGPGIPRGPETGPLIGELLAALDGGCASVIDADGLNALAEHRERIARWLARAPVQPLLTPHPGEFARLTGEEVERIEADRLESAARAAQRFSACVVLKGARSVVANPEGRTAVCAAGNPGMATAGSGDVLTGISAAVLARRGGEGGTFERAQLAVFLHAFAGDLAALRFGQTGLIASDIIRTGLPRVFRRWGR